MRPPKNIKLFLNIPIFILACFLIASPITAESNELISEFPLDHYSQNINDWMNPNDPNYEKPLVAKDVHDKQFEIFLDHYFGAASPWNEQYVRPILSQKAPDDLTTLMQSIITNFDNRGKPTNEIGYGENFHPHDTNWIDKIADNMNIAQFNNLTYHPENRAIAVDNILGRVLPTNDPHYYSHLLAGQGYPFDNLQMSSIWAGTPLYIVGESRNHAWVLVITPDFICWVENKNIAKASATFIDRWQKQARTLLVAVTKNEMSLVDKQNNFLFTGYIGSIFPAEQLGENFKLLVPVKNNNNEAQIAYAESNNEQVARMPLDVTRKNFARLMSTLAGRPYGWGNTYFYNDCSGELKNLFTPFGIYLARHSSYQINSGRLVDKTYASTQERLQYLMKNGKPFMTIIYIGGHVLMYLGNYPNPNDPQHEPMAMTYQNMWGLKPNPPIRRAVIGQAVFLPMLLSYPEDSTLNTEAAAKYFQIAYLDELPEKPTAIWSDRLLLKALMMPEWAQ